MSTAVSVEGELTVYAVHDLKARLLAALNEVSLLQIDLSDVSEVDGAGIQLLLAAQREARQRGAALRLTSVPPQVADALALMDLTHEFDTSPAEHAEHSA
ncbi:MAG TPA: STAS domain-containing protein [Aquabacterium sp.]|uniref:STAS domain-containing protein n=1 Tax=Aquabacterium sp. TaxID=1872578 RepID=UPI002E356F7B|nr:STAS domain-containing protein [Aquabacterium sp.]HEX5355834.1 STAS domain-containing protein [Aquabacterium sp.]